MAKAMRKRCSLILSDQNHRFEGEMIGAPVNSSGQLVFTTGMVGYSEAITDPSYLGQILVFAYPLIGNYGIPKLPDLKDLDAVIPRGFESHQAQCAGVIITADSSDTYHWNSLQTLDAWLKDQGVPGIVGLDTRHLVHLIREGRNLLASIEPKESEGFHSFNHIDWTPEKDKYFDPGQYEVLSEVSTEKPRVVGKGSRRIAVVDCGVKWNIIRQLIELDCEVELLPWDYDLSKVDCSAWLISNGPGDPAKTGDLKSSIVRLLEGERPVLGICLGHQLLSLAAGAETIRMPYGHRSHNQPVYEVGTRRGYITSQNHGYVVVESSIKGDWEPWFKNVNDESIEGIKHKTKPFRSVQFHPEAAGGPRDTGWILEQFIAGV